MIKDLARSIPEVDGNRLEPTMVTIAGRRFARAQIRGTPLSCIVLATGIRCHVLVFSFTGADDGQLKELEASLSRLSLAADRSAPMCIGGYATSETVLRKVGPPPIGQQFLKIPVRLVIGADGKVKHSHIIRAPGDLQKSIASALAEWEFKPYQPDGHPVEIETGLVLEFKPDGPERSR